MKNKFRTWSKHHGKFQNNILICNHIPYIVTRADITGKRTMMSILEETGLPESNFINQQSTGLFDKNNQEIFEGDILFGETRNDPKIPTFTGIVEFHQPTASFLIRSEDGFTRGLNSLYNPEIKGNTYEN